MSWLLVVSLLCLFLLGVLLAIRDARHHRRLRGWDEER